MNREDAFYDRKKRVSECTTCRSRHMTEDEIMQERRNSGWNPYWAEEETVMSDNMRTGDAQNEQQQETWGMLMGNDPMLESQRVAERDLRQLQSMYPEAAKSMLPYIEDICDKMEYDGSSMYDQYPDRMTIYRLAEEIYEKVKNKYPEQLSVVKDEMLAMQHRPPYGYNQPGINWVQDLARVLLLNEMHHRRRRKKNLFN